LILGPDMRADAAAKCDGSEQRRTRARAKVATGSTMVEKYQRGGLNSSTPRSTFEVRVPLLLHHEVAGNRRRKRAPGPFSQQFERAAGFRGERPLM